MKTILKEIKHYFSEGEINELAKELATNIKQYEILEDEKSKAQQDYKHKLDSVDNLIQQLADKVKNGFSVENIECKVGHDYENSRLTFTDVLTGECILTEPMPESDMNSIFIRTGTEL